MTQEADNRKPSRLRARLQAARDDVRGIALQTIIIIVVLLAIAGAVAIALQQRAGDEIENLESSGSSNLVFYGITAQTLCAVQGGTWTATHALIPTTATSPLANGLKAAGRLPLSANAGYCEP